MGMTLSWIQEGCILEYVVSGTVTHADLVHMLQEEPRFYNTVSNFPLLVLLDFTHMTRCPINVLPTVLKSELVRSRRGYMAMVKAPTVAQTVSVLAARVRGRSDYAFYTTREQALRALETRLESRNGAAWMR